MPAVERIESGKCYHRKRGLLVSVRKVERGDGEEVSYRGLARVAAR